MQYRVAGKTGMQVSVIGLGAEHLDNKPYEFVEEVIHTALEQGINMLDLFMPGEEVRGNIGRALAGNRDKMRIQGHIGSVDLREQYDVSRDVEVCKRYFETLLRCLNTDYMDFGMLFFVDTAEDVDAILNNGVVRYAQDLKRQGVIRAVGASSHNPHTALRLVESGLVEHLMFSINAAFDLMPDMTDIQKMLGDDFTGKATIMDPARAELYRQCQSRQVSISVMKSLGAGKLLSAEHSPFAGPLTPVQCIHYALTRPAVVSALVGCQSREQILEAVRYLEASDAEKDYAPAVSAFRADRKEGFKGSCVYCNHCLPCPVDIDIASVNKYLDIALLDASAVPPSVAQHYRALDRHGSDCTSCGSCEERCPFSVSVIANMQRAADVFGA